MKVECGARLADRSRFAIQGPERSSSEGNINVEKPSRAKGRVRRVTIFALALSCLLAVSAFPQENVDDPWAKYTPGKLSKITQAEAFQNMQEMGGVTLGIPATPIRARVTYMGKLRPISDDTRSLVMLWMQSNRYSEEIFNMYSREGLFVEDSVEYWLPVQSTLLPHMDEELKEGDSVDLFVVWIGITFAEPPGKRQHVFIVNEFRTVAVADHKASRATVPPQ